MTTALDLTSLVTLTASNGGTVRLWDDFLYTNSNATQLDLGLAHIECVGGSQQLEVGGTHVDLEIQLLPDRNFGYEQLIVGQEGLTTVAKLVDLHDNHQPGIPDALYLFGIEDVEGVGGLEGLKILGGSTLVIHDLNVYALLDLNLERMTDGVMEWIRIRDLFLPGQTIILFNHGGNDGFIAIEIIEPEPGTIIIEKQTEPDAALGLFEFTGDAAGLITDGEQIVVADLFPGVYTSTEIVPVGWALASIECDDIDSSGDFSAKTATFQLMEGETVKCIFTNCLDDDGDGVCNSVDPCPLVLQRRIGSSEAAI